MFCHVAGKTSLPYWSCPRGHMSTSSLWTDNGYMTLVKYVCTRYHWGGHHLIMCCIIPYSKLKTMDLVLLTM